MRATSARSTTGSNRVQKLTAFFEQGSPRDRNSLQPDDNSPSSTTGWISTPSTNHMSSATVDVKVTISRRKQAAKALEDLVDAASIEDPSSELFLLSSDSTSDAHLPSQQRPLQEAENYPPLPHVYRVVTTSTSSLPLATGSCIDSADTMTSVAQSWEDHQDNDHEQCLSDSSDMNVLVIKLVREWSRGGESLQCAQSPESDREESSVTSPTLTDSPSMHHHHHHDNPALEDEDIDDNMSESSIHQRAVKWYRQSLIALKTAVNRNRLPLSCRLTPCTPHLIGDRSPRSIPAAKNRRQQMLQRRGSLLVTTDAQAALNFQGFSASAGFRKALARARSSAQIPNLTRNSFGPAGKTKSSLRNSIAESVVGVQLASCEVEVDQEELPKTGGGVPAEVIEEDIGVASSSSSSRTSSIDCESMFKKEKGKFASQHRIWRAEQILRLQKQKAAASKQYEDNERGDGIDDDDLGGGVGGGGVDRTPQEKGLVQYLRPPSTKSRAQQLRRQRFRCPDCKALLEQPFQSIFPYGGRWFADITGSTIADDVEETEERKYARRCSFTGAYYCGDCHVNDMSVIPYRVITFFDFCPRPVSRSVYKTLNDLSGEPLILYKNIHPVVKKSNPEIYAIHAVRRNVVMLKRFILDCYRRHRMHTLTPKKKCIALFCIQLTEDVMQYLPGRHWIERSDLYSIRDMEAIKSYQQIMARENTFLNSVMDSIRWAAENLLPMKTRKEIALEESNEMTSSQPYSLDEDEQATFFVFKLKAFEEFWISHLVPSSANYDDDSLCERCIAAFELYCAEHNHIH